MKQTITAFSIDGTPQTIIIEAPTLCSYCDIGVEAQHLYSVVMPQQGHQTVREIFSLFRCPHCEQCMMVQSFIHENGDSANTLVVLPERKHIKVNFDKIERISPAFVQIYTQAAKAETCGLDLICGMGYRKSVEFLIKDYAMHIYPDEEQSILNMWLKPCIDKYIDNEGIKTLAIASTWLGNDETHYVRKRPTYDVNDLKAFIDALVHHIESKLALEDALELLSSQSS